MDFPKKYKEPGSKRPIFVGLHTEPTGVIGYKILQRTERQTVNVPFHGTDGRTVIQNKMWRTEDEAQSYLDRLAKARHWKQI